ncbi:prepilin peptidase [Staphylococcus pseudintermedius]|nr:prepilin peptidase [Staphylococcus pseudintermedius]MDK4117167.1 prepilin peptidase [Staphylococcus pseudintermedius]MDX8286855.1 prepilin peptidase [Staphylococcus pseudintermedius]USE51627.1 prepilin peptidase [Staphylococcus pseudintermedius]USF93342.1 prepilin peptidase [Staphylococcus pseudintermedius]USJ69403.1 prepilin peptidase [Staphylococcus pseudintermedius]
MRHCLQRSKCQTCQHELKLLDLVPILSYCALKGRCRFCRQRIPISLFIGEVLGGALLFIRYYYLYTFRLRRFMSWRYYYSQLQLLIYVHS